LKISSPDIIHKVDVGGVELDLKNEAGVKQAFHSVVNRVKSARPDAKILGVNIQEFVGGGKEVIIGMKRDPQFGPMIMFGSGGIYVSVYNDVSFRLAPITKMVAQEMIESTKAFKLLSGIRGEKPSDVESVIECLQRISQLALEFPEVLEIDINPLRVFEKGCKAVDARMVIS
jgi:acetyltransferase